jgi:hypothetical protein
LTQKQQDKASKLKDLYDLSSAADLFTLLPQEMEVMEIKGKANDLDGHTKKSEVMSIISEIAAKSGVEIDTETLSVFIDVINAASKGKYALNKGDL